MVVYKNMGDVCFYVVGDMSENELLLENVLNTLTETMSLLLRYTRYSVQVKRDVV